MQYVEFDGDCPPAPVDATNLLIAITKGDGKKVDAILRERQPSLDDGGLLNVMGYLVGCVAAILMSMKKESRDEILEGLRKSAVAAAESAPKPARAAGNGPSPYL